MKLINNTLLAFTAEGVANSLALAGQLGLDTPSVVDAFAGSPLVSQWTAGKLRRLQDGDYSPEFLWLWPSRTSILPWRKPARSV